MNQTSWWSTRNIWRCSWNHDTRIIFKASKNLHFRRENFQSEVRFSSLNEHLHKSEFKFKVISINQPPFYCTIIPIILSSCKSFGVLTRHCSLRFMIIIYKLIHWWLMTKNPQNVYILDLISDLTFWFKRTPQTAKLILIQSNLSVDSKCLRFVYIVCSFNFQVLWSCFCKILLNYCLGWWTPELRHEKVELTLIHEPLLTWPSHILFFVWNIEVISD